MATVLMVPVHLDALHVKTPVAVVGPTLPYERLPHHVDGRAVNPDVPYLASALVRSAFHQLGQKLASGVHLHWSLPDALTHDDGDRGLRRAPNRWVVRRDGGGLAERTWLIESDVVRFGNRAPGVAAGIPWADGRRLAWLGRTRPMAEDGTPVDVDPATDVDVLDPFTVDIAGEVTFAALYSRSAGVFGLHDPDIGVEIEPGLRYLLYGYHERAADDPVAGGTPLDVLRWTAVTDVVDRSAYFATLDFPTGTPAGTPDGPHPVDVALGATTEEALGALEAEHDLPLEEAVAAMQYLAESGRIDTDLQHALDEHRHSQGFHAEVGEARWMLRPAPRSGGDETGGAASAGGGIDTDAGLAEAFGQLVDVQRRYDTARRRMTALRAQLFDDWCRYLLSAYPHEGTRLGDLPDIDDIRQHIEVRLLQPLDDLAERTGRVLWFQGGSDQPVRPRVDDTRPGRLAHQLVEAWRVVQERLPVGAGGAATFELVLAPGARFWRPRELSLVVRGDSVSPSVRHGADGRLDAKGRLVCRWLTADGPSASVADQAVVFGTVDEWFSDWAGDEAPSIGFSRARAQPWHPLVLQWALDYEALAHGRPANGHGPYPPEFLTASFRHDPHRPELVHATADPPRSSPVPLSGWSLFTRGAQRTVSAAIRRYEKELDQRNAEPPAVVAGLLALADRLEAAPPVLAATLNGLDDALVMRTRSPQLPVRDPMALPGSVYEAFAHRVAAWVGDPPGGAPDPALELHPLRTGFVRLDDLQVIGNFGTVRTLTFGHVRLPATFPELQGDEHAFLPPRILRPGRLRFRWLDASADDRESTDHPTTGPVHGWLVIDHLDARILAFAGNGTRLGTLDLDGDEVVWTRASNSTSGDRTVSDVMVAVLERLRRRDKAWFDGFIGAMAEAQELIDPADAGRHRVLSMLVSRPIAVARALLDIELAGVPPRSSDWDAFRRAVDDTTEGDDSEMGAVDVPVRLGAPPPADDRAARLDDGLLGFWTDGDDTLRTPKSTWTAADLAPHDDPTHPPQVTVSTGGGPVGVTMLLDPRGQVHAISGVLPTKRLALDPDQVAGALGAMEVSFRAGPLLTRPGFVDHVEPSDPGLRWRWVDDDASADEQPITPLTTQAPIPAALELRDGFLRLSRDPRSS